MYAHVRKGHGVGAPAPSQPQGERYRLSPWTRLRLSWMQSQEYRLWRQSLSLRVWR